MSGRAVWLAMTGVVLAAASLQAQISPHPAPMGPRTAEQERWYVAGEPVVLNGTPYYPSGPIVHFNRQEMVRSGSVDGVPFYTRTTIEPGSIIYVPLEGGLVRPYERRRDGDVAGTAGSTVPSFPIMLRAEASRLPPPPLRASAPPTGGGVMSPGFVREVESSPPAAIAGPPEGAVGTTGTTLPAASGSLRTARLPEGLNAVFIEFEAARWFASGPARRFDPTHLREVGHYHGFVVYADPARPDTVFVPHVDGEPGLVTPYRSR